MPTADARLLLRDLLGFATRPERLPPEDGNDAAGPLHVSAVVVSEALQQVSLFPPNPIQVHGKDRDETSPPGDPVVEQ